jgi:phage gp36-like protein
MATAYASLADIGIYGLNTATLPPWIVTSTQQAKLDAANAKVDSYLNSKFRLPLVAYGKDIVEAAAVMAAFELIVLRGFDPESEKDKIFSDRYERTIKWLEGIAAGTVLPNVTEPPSDGTGASYVRQPAASTTGTGFVISKPSARGW